MADDDDLRGDLRWGTTPGLLASAIERFADEEAVVDGETRLSWIELGQWVDRAARAFLADGIERGDRVAIWAPNCWEWIVALLGLQSVGAAVVPLNTRYKGGEAGYILRASRARILVTVNGFLDNSYIDLLSQEELPDVERIVVLRSDDAPTARQAPTQSWDDFLATGDSVEALQVEKRRREIAPDDIADLLFTSGTTGHPKGVLQTHAQTIRAFTSWADVVGLRHGDRYLIVNPFFHAFGYKAGIVACLVTGAVMLPLPVFDVPTVMRAIDAERISMLPGPPTLYQTILNHPDRRSVDTSSLRLAVTGAAAVPVSLVERMWDDLGFSTVITGYGLTEACGIATMCRHDDDATTIANTSGRAIPGVEVRITDDHGTEVPRGQAGEIVVRGYNVMTGYFEDPEETAATVDPDGWLHTGDIGVMDDRGYVRITDRKKDMYIVGGFNAYPAEIENLLSRHPAVAQVAVVGVPDERMGEVGMAFVVRTTGVEPVTEQELIAWARDAMANYKVPRHVRFLDALPLNASGKVLKYELRDKALARTGGQT